MPCTEGEEIAVFRRPPDGPWPTDGGVQCFARLSRQFHIFLKYCLLSTSCRFFLIFENRLLTTRRVKAYKPLTDEDGGAAGADDLLRSDVSLETAGFVGVICWKAVILLVWF